MHYDLSQCPVISLILFRATDYSDEFVRSMVLSITVKPFSAVVMCRQGSYGLFLCYILCACISQVSCSFMLHSVLHSETTPVDFR